MASVEEAVAVVAEGKGIILRKNIYLKKEEDIEETEVREDLKVKFLKEVKEEKKFKEKPKNKNLLSIVFKNDGSLFVKREIIMFLYS